MPLAYDLHSHSTASDGALTPTALVWRAAHAGLAVLALTDHDTVAGVAEAQRAAAGLPITLVPGVEISVTWGGRTVHIVGLNLDPDCATLRAGLDGLLAERAGRAEEISARLARAGIPDALAGARAHCAGAQLGRTHFARFLVARGLGRDLRDVFKHYLAEGRPGHVAGDWATLPQALDWIRAAGGLAVIAHPARYRFTRTKLRRLIGEFRDGGGIGIEVVSGSHNRDDVHAMAALARETRLLASAGSDYHGPDTPWIELGRLGQLPDACRAIWTWPAFPRAPLDSIRDGISPPLAVPAFAC